MSESGLRERTRRAVRKEIAEAAERLFLERGYEATTIDDIASAVGMSQRSVFRYFATKEEIVVGKFELAGDDLLEALRERPAGEPLWTSLQEMFAALGALSQIPGHAELAEPMQRVVLETPALLASYLQKMQGLQTRVVEEFERRAQEAGRPYAPDDPTPRALTSAAFGCLVAAQYAWLAAPHKTTIAEAITRAMSTLTPTA